jgi:hypothetical protein
LLNQTRQAETPVGLQEWTVPQAVNLRDGMYLSIMERRMNLQKIFPGILTVLFALFFVPSVFAHGDEPRLEISLERVNPGGVIDVRGVDFEFEEVVTLELVGSEAALPIGTTVADVEGVFVQIVSLPVDLSAGMYQFRATTDDHVIISPTFEVWGAPMADEGGEGERDEDDGLLAPMPTVAQNPSVMQAGVVQASETPEAPDSTFPWMIVVIAISAVIVLVLVLSLNRKRG